MIGTSHTLAVSRRRLQRRHLHHAAGDLVLAPTATTRLVPQFAASSAPGLPSSGPADQLRQALAERRQDAFARIAAGMSNNEIAASLFLSEETVRIHVGRSGAPKYRLLGARLTGEPEQRGH